MSVPPICEHARAALEDAKKVTKGRQKQLNDAEVKLNQLLAAQPPDEAAIEAQKVQVEVARNAWMAARKTQKDWQEAVDELCTP
ncbi:hypothetical protein PV726_44050 [Streptomyces europaeiscabiei]|uniref:hypothetical protein n=1 Tax=Streptomyces europaeiscabiei TaxID=146819 RepID=UPI0029BF16B6|nr:hypothetical protein [Streptomyces europaeiscabiei]MDX3697084.1 hypothetical protein [Streptomyces europaeiscabiei]